MRGPVRDGETEPSSKRRQGERQHEAIVETIRQEEKENRGRQQIEIPLSGKQVQAGLKVRKFDAPDEAAQVKHIVENRIRGRRLRERPSGHAGKAIPKTGG